MNGFDEYPEIRNSPQNMGNYDPIHAMLVKRKQQRDNGEEPLLPKVEYKNEDVKALEEFCQKYGIIGFSTGTMSPVIALRMLKSKMGIIETPTQVNTKKQLLYG